MRKREDPGIKLHLNNEEIQSTNSARLLGLQVHKDLTQNYYINEMQDSLMRQVETRFRKSYRNFMIMMKFFLVRIRTMSVSFYIDKTVIYHY